MYSLAWNLFSGEVIHITLHDIFMLVSIVWVAIQAWEKLKEKKK